MVERVAAALESPQLSPEGRDRALTFLRIHRSASRAFEERRPDAFVHRLIERIGLRRQQVFAAQADTVERLVNIAKLSELAAAYMRREPERHGARLHPLPRRGRRGRAARGGGGGRPTAPRGAGHVDGGGAKGREFEHVFVLGLSAARMPGPLPRRRPTPCPPSCSRSACPHDRARRDHEAAMRRLLHVAMTRARRGSCSRGRSPAEHGAAPRPVALLRGGAGGARRRGGDLRGGAVRARRGPPLDVPHHARRAARHGRARGRAARGDAARHLPRRRPGGVALPRADQARGADRARQGGPDASTRRSPRSTSSCSRCATPEQRELLEASRARRLPARLRARRATPPRPRSAAGPSESLEPFIPRRGDGLMLSASRHRDLPALPAQVQVRARLPDPAGADDQPALRDRRPPGARALPPGQAAARSRPDGAVRGVLAAQRASATRTTSCSSARSAVAALRRYWAEDRDAEGEPVWFERSLRVPASGRTCCAAASTASTATRTGRYELIDYKTGKAKTEAGAARGHPALRLPDGRARGVGARDLGAELLLRARRREGAGRALGGGARAGARHRGRDRRRDHEPRLRADAVARDLRFCDYRIVCPAAEK